MLFLLACRPGPVALAPDEAADSGEPVETIGADTAVRWVACEDPAVRLNELVTANLHGAEDEDGDTPDWIEVAADTTVSLEGWGLSRDGRVEWVFPATELTPEAPVRVWASEKEGDVSFSLDAFGETVFLHGPDGCVADRVETGRLYADIALGRDTAGAWAYFLEPTPGAPNTTESRPGFATPPTFDRAGGFEAGPVVVTVDAPGAIYYTLDGSIPTAKSEPYAGPLTLDVAEQPVPLRAIAVEDGLWPSRITTATYGDPEYLEGVRLISLVMDPDDLWDPMTGIYVYGPNAEPSYPYFGANFWQVWERDLHVEIWDGTGAPLVSQDAGIQIAGGYSRAFDQRNFEIIARSGYGPETMDAKLFDDESIDEWHRLYLRNGGDWCGTQLVDATVQSLFRDASGARLPGADAQAYEPALVFINGEFWGLYELKERLDENWIADHRGEGPDDLDRVKLGWTHDANWEVEEGDWAAFEELEALVAAEDLADPDAYAAFAEQVDVTNFAVSNLAHEWIGNTDWWGNNVRMWRPRRDDGRWRWMVYDFGHGWNYPSYDHLSVSVSGNWRGLPIGEALTNADFKALFVQAHADLFATSMAPETAAATVDALAEEIRPVFDRQIERWCPSGSMEGWQAGIAFARSFAEQRPGELDADLIQHLGLAGHAELSLVADPPEGGRFQLAVVEAESGFSGTYYLDSPVNVTAVAADGWTFAGWSDGETAAARVLPMDADTSVTAVFEAR